MGFYFTSADAWDLAYQAQIGRDSAARSTAPTSRRRPASFGGQARRATRPRNRERRGESGAPASERVEGSRPSTRAQAAPSNVEGGDEAPRAKLTWRATKPTSSSSAAASPPRWSPRSWPSCVPAGPSSSSRPASGCSTSRTASSTAQRSLDYGENQWPGDFVADQARARRHFAHDGGRRIGAALGRRVQSILGRRHAAEVAVRPRGGLADRVEGARDVLLRGRAAPRRVGRAEPARRKTGASEPYPMPAMPMTLQPDPAQGVGGAERHPVLDDAAGEEHGGRLRRPRQVPALQHVRDLSDRRALFAGLDVQAAARREEDPAPRPDAGAQARARRRRRRASRPRRRRARTAPTTTSSIARARSSSRPATAGARTCCCSRPTSRFPNGLANSSDHVGRYMTGHLAYQTTIDLDLKIYPGMNEQHSLISRQFFRCRPDQPYVRHDLRVWENAGGRGPQLRDATASCCSATRCWPTGARGRRAAPRACAATTTCIPTRTAG